MLPSRPFRIGGRPRVLPHRGARAGNSDNGLVIGLRHLHRTKENIGDAGTGYGVIWVGGAGAPGVGGEQIYFDLSYRGYVEPERQLVPQISVP